MDETPSGGRGVVLAALTVVGMTKTRVFGSFNDPKIEAISGRASSHWVKEAAWDYAERGRRRERRDNRR